MIDQFMTNHHVCESPRNRDRNKQILSTKSQNNVLYKTTRNIGREELMVNSIESYVVSAYFFGKSISSYLVNLVVRDTEAAATAVPGSRTIDVNLLIQ